MEAALNSSVTRPRLTADDLLSPFVGALTPAAMWRIGTEAEKFGVLSENGQAIAYEGPRGVRAIFDILQRDYGWYPHAEYEGGDIISLERGAESITLEPGGQVE